MLLEVAGSVSSDVSKAHSATHSGNKDVMMLLVNDSLLIACLGLPLRGVENLLSNSNGCYTLRVREIGQWDLRSIETTRVAIEPRATRSCSIWLPLGFL